MPRSNVLLSLSTEDNDYQRAQAEAALSAAVSHGLRVEIQYAQNDAVLQVQQILRVLQKKERQFDAVISQPVGTSMEQVARQAAALGVAWGILNYETPYISSLRRTSKAPMFEITNDNIEIGRIQAKQTAALLPTGGVVLYVEGPATGGAARLRSEGMLSAIPSNIELRILKGDWTQASTRRGVTNWLALSTSRRLGIAAVICQNDAMALGVREAFENTPAGAERNTWLSLPITGCDGLPNGGQEMVRRGILASTIVVEPNAGTAIELFAGSLKGRQVPEKTMCVGTSYPPIDQLRQRRSAAVAF